MAVKAATLGAQEAHEAHFTFPIVGKRYTPEGNLEVYGPCTDGTLDADHQKVDPAWSAKALGTWIDTGGNLRVQHSPFLYPAGRGLALETFKDGDSHYLKALVLKSTPAFDLVENRVLRDFSIGVLDPVTQYNDPTAPGGTICGGMIGEVSLVDRGSNKNTTFTIVKSARKEPAELILQMTGYSDGPSGIAARKSARLHAYKTWIVPVQKRKTKGGKVVDSSGKDRSSTPDSDFAGPDKTFPIDNASDVSDAASLAHHADDPGEVRAKIKRIARRKLGISEDKMPASLKADSTEDDTEETDKVPFPGARPPFGKKPKKDKGDAAEDYPGDKGEDGETVAEYNADDGDDKDDDEPDEDDDKKSSKAVDAKALRKKLIKKQRRALEASLKGDGVSLGVRPGDNGGRTAAGPNWHPDPDAAEDHATGVKDKKMRPAGKHREPDGAQAEGIEVDAGMDSDHEGGDKTGVPGSKWNGKANREDPGFGIRRLHDAVCPAFRWKRVSKAYGGLDGVEAAVPERELQTLAMKAIGDGDFDLASHYTAMLELVGSMQTIGPDMLLEARKAFPELYPNVHPRQQHDIRPSQFTGGYVGSGHAPLHAGGSGGAKLPEAPVRHVSASQFQRGFQDSGVSSMSPSGGTQASASTAAFGQALNTLASMHTRIHSMFPEMCPLGVEQMDLTQAEGQTGIRPASMRPAPARSVGEGGRPAMKAAGAAQALGPDGIEAKLRKKMAKMSTKMAELAEENDRLGSMPSNDPDDAAYRGVPELSGPVDRKSLVAKSFPGGDEGDGDQSEFRDYLEMVATTSGDPKMRMNASKVLTAMITK